MQPGRFAAEHFIDADLVKCFSPFFKISAFLGCSGISIKQQMVTTPTVLQKIYTLLCIAAFTFSFYYFEEYYYTTFYNEDSTMYFAGVIGTLVQYTSYISNTIYTRFCSSESAIKLWLKLQKVDSILALKEFNHLKKQQYYWNLIVLLLYIAWFECGFTIHSMATVEYPILTMFGGMGLLNVYLELILAASLIFYLLIRLRFLNKVVKYNFYVKCRNNEVPRSPIPLNESFIISADLNDGNNLDLEKFLVCLKEILKLYKLITELFSFPVLNIVTTVFSWALLVTLTMIIGLRTEVVSVIVIIIICVWFVYYFILITMLALVSDYFIQEVRRTRLLCIHTMACCFEEPIWKGAHDILRTIQYYKPTFSVYGIFTMDRKLPLSLIGIITTNLAILIQFTIPNYMQT